jgi:ribonuclease-3 family protein
MKAPVNTTALAFVGDAVYELYIRKLILEKGETSADKLHQMAVKYVKAEGQAKALREISGSLCESEQALVKRARNRKSASKPKNADPVEYKLATAFEALIGYLYLEGHEERLDEILRLAVTAIEGAKL